MRKGTRFVGARPDGQPRTTLVAAIAVTCFACSSSAPADRPPGADAGRPDSAAPVDGGPAGDASPDGGPDGAFGPPAPLCDPKATWKAEQKLAASTALDDGFGSVTPDELTIAWTVDTGGSVEVRVADRASPSEPFGPPQTPVTGVALDRAALSPDGLRLVFVEAGRRRFGHHARATRADAFAPSAFYPFEALEAVLLADELYGDPVLAPDDHTFFYSRYGGGRTDTIESSARVFTKDPWGPGGGVLSVPELVATATARRRPTGIASDGRTLFFFDETTQKQKGVWFKYDSLDIESVVDLGTRQGATPNGACTRLYFSQAKDLFTADRN